MGDLSCAEAVGRWENKLMVMDKCLGKHLHLRRSSPCLENSHTMICLLTPPLDKQSLWLVYK